MTAPWHMLHICLSCY